MFAIIIITSTKEVIVRVILIIRFEEDYNVAAFTNSNALSHKSYTRFLCIVSYVYANLRESIAFEVDSVCSFCLY